MHNRDAGEFPMNQEPQSSTSPSVSAEVQDFYERYPCLDRSTVSKKNLQLWQDGVRRRAERMHSPNGSQIEKVRPSFEFLWWADQVVFDTSQRQTVPNG
jgi:hypothetical protein